MKKIAVAILTAGSICVAGFAAHAQEFTLDLKKIDPSTTEGQFKIKEWKENVAEAYCGPLDIPQPLDLIEYRTKCQVSIKADAQAKIDEAIARRDAALKYRIVAQR